MNTLKINFKLLLAFILTIGIAIQFSGCEEENNDPDPPADADNIILSNSNILTDEDGMTLYFFTRDVAGESQCEDGCLDNWPVFFVEDFNLGNGLDEADFENITREDGEQQTTYKGWPLYYFSGDNDAGQTNGEGLSNVWFVAKPDYSIMLANAQLVGEDGVNYTSEYEVGEETTQYMVDAEGRTIYRFINDTKDQNNFTNEDFSNNGVWPIFYTDIESLPSTLSSDDFGTIDVFGEQQLTYKGWPLYYFGQDGNRGENKGVSFPSPGVWPIANTDTEEAEEEMASPTVMTIGNEAFGTILTDENEQVLYFFANDVGGESNCEGGCLNFWPKFYTEEVILGEESVLDSEDFGTIGEGEDMQTTYKGWPLYYYSPTGDGELENPGTSSGDGTNGEWFIAKEDYSLMLGNAQLVGHDGENYTSEYEVGEEITMYFTDDEGNTLYLFANDSKDNNTFTNEDFGNNGVWPIFFTEIDRLPSGINAEDFGEIDVFGEPQLTYKGWPLYYFGQDESRGDNKGVSFPSPAVWPIVNTSTEAAPE